MARNSLHIMNRRRRTHRGFTLIEVLVVVAIIALLVAILIPSLSKARDQARKARCLANMSNTPKAVLQFAQTHKGRGQLISSNDTDINQADSSRSMFAYQSDYNGTPGPWLKCWPVAYASELGFRSLKVNQNYTDPTFTKNPDFYYRKFGKYEVLQCPADKIPVRDLMVNAPAAFPQLYGVTSYAANLDVFGVSGAGQPWDNGAVSAPPGRGRLKGRLESIVRPAEVALFVDGGLEHRLRQSATMSSFLKSAGNKGPYLEHVSWIDKSLPLERHGKGGLCVALADGSGTFVQPVSWFYDGPPDTPGGVGIFSDITGSYVRLYYARKYSKQIRVSPYQVGASTGLPP